MGRISTLTPPGTYTVELEAAGKKSSQRLTVVKDPHSEGSITDMNLSELAASTSTISNEPS